MSAMWFYSQGRAERQGPVPQEEIQRLLAEGSIHSGHLVWTEGMADWTPVGMRPEFRAAIAAAPQPAPAAGPRAMPEKLGGWMSFVGIMGIIGGLFQCLSCVGIVVGVPMIIAGVAMLGARSALEAAPAMDPGLQPFFEKLRTCILATGVMYIVGMVLILLLIVIYFGVFAAVVSGAMQSR